MEFLKYSKCLDRHQQLAVGKGKNIRKYNVLTCKRKQVIKLQRHLYGSSCLLPWNGFCVEQLSVGTI